ncbi:hypothetical protein CVT26_011433 [Gymnopilus dilepis]|uniref:Uncharacterized protein n=1 Tax=Gymnopilus dilepis TaxID=231916 RepID=A0A409XBX5_9AGAR|nr:hypothetical protein CVT26_011433 [Gymnopilus dilepis]
MSFSDIAIALFDNRDVGIDGNESAPEDDPSDMETEDSEVEEDQEASESEEEDAEEDEETSESESVHDLRDKVRSILDEFDNHNLKVIDFLDALSWGDRACTGDAKIRVERTILLKDAKLKGILHHWAVPPRRQGSNKRRKAEREFPPSRSSSWWLLSRGRPAGFGTSVHAGGHGKKKSLPFFDVGEIQRVRDKVI